MALKVFVAASTILNKEVHGDFFDRFKHSDSVPADDDAVRNDNATKADLRRGVSALGVVKVGEAETFFRDQSVDASFKRFAEFCRVRQIDLTVVSDGLDFCVTSILALNGIRDLRIFANRTEIVGSGETARLSITFPYDDAECTLCACCARNIMLTSCGDHDRIVFVGESETDRCPAGYADVVFAKDALQRYCQERNISYFLYSSFHDVGERLERLSVGRNLKPRREAAMKRRDAFIAE